jgi:hypothetical protein
LPFVWVGQLQWTFSVNGRKGVGIYTDRRFELDRSQPASRPVGDGPPRALHADSPGTVTGFRGVAPGTVGFPLNQSQSNQRSCLTIGGSSIRPSRGLCTIVTSAPAELAENDQPKAKSKEGPWARPVLMTPIRRYYEPGTSPRTHQALAFSVNGPSWRSPSKRLRIRASSCCRRSSESDTTNAPPGPAPFVNGSQ